jgi:hypothetical protein
MPIEPLRENTSMPPRASDEVVSFHRKVAGLCVDRLHDALNPASHLFDRQLRDKRWGETLDTEDVTSTAICLIGLHRAGVNSSRVGLRLRPTIDAMSRALKRRAYPGGFGLVVWANAVWNELTFDQLVEQCGLNLDAAREFVAPLTTMETAWLLSGLIHEVKRSGNTRAHAAKEVVLAELLGRFRPKTGIFLHASDRAPVRHRLRKHVANFADQIYSVQALAFAAITERSKPALEASQVCAKRLVELQGPLGQWWWHYDPRTGGVAQGFPVYSVHQHAMAPMALMSVAAAGGTDHRAAIDLSHRWLKQNELSVDMVDLGQGTIWRDIEPEESDIERLARHSRSVLGWRPVEAAKLAGRLKVNHETRPYEWAWCLFAGSIAAGHSKERHVV